MKKQIFITLAFLLVGLTVITTYAQTKEITPTEADYTDWLFVQSDKALQHRFAVVKKEGSVSYLQLQFRVKSDDEIHCRGAQCDGYVLYMSHDNVARTDTVSYNLYFEPSFVGDKVYNFTQLIPIELKTWENGSRRYIDKKHGIVISYANGYTENAQYFYNCVDFKLKNGPKHRCDDFDISKAVRVSESNVVETKASSQEKKAGIESQSKVQPSTDTQSEASKILAERKLAKQKEQDAIDEEKQKRDKVNEPLIEGVRENYLDVVQIALKEGASAKTISPDLMRTAIANALKTANDKMLRTIISAGADPNMAFVACYKFELDCSDSFKLFLIESGADVNQSVYEHVNEYLLDDNGTMKTVQHKIPALYREIESKPKSAEVVKALIKAGANVNYKTAHNENTPLIQAMSDCNLEIIQALVDAGADFRHRWKASDLTIMVSPYEDAKWNCKAAMPIFKSKR